MGRGRGNIRQTTTPPGDAARRPRPQVPRLQPHRHARVDVRVAAALVAAWRCGAPPGSGGALAMRSARPRPTRRRAASPCGPEARGYAESGTERRRATNAASPPPSRTGGRPAVRIGSAPATVAAVRSPRSRFPTVVSPLRTSSGEIIDGRAPRYSAARRLVAGGASRGFAREVDAVRRRHVGGVRLSRQMVETRTAVAYHRPARRRPKSPPGVAGRRLVGEELLADSGTGSACRRARSPLRTSSRLKKVPSARNT